MELDKLKVFYVYHHKANSAGRNKRRNEELIELVKTLQMRGIASPFVLIYEI
jgi:hypothetical protein